MSFVNRGIDFPREGKTKSEFRKEKKYEKRKRTNDELFVTKPNERNEAAKRPKKHKNKSKNKTEEDEEDEFNVIEELTVQSLPIGAVVLGCIQEIKDYDVKLSLSGDIQVTVPISNFSDKYTELLEKFADDSVNNEPPLKPNALFKVGEYFPVKILSKEVDNHTYQGCSVTRIHVIGSLNPKEVYEDVIPSVFLKHCANLTVTAAVSSVEDYGYIMDGGVNDVKSFLRKKDCEPFFQKYGLKELSLGQIILCTVKNCNERIVNLTTENIFSNKQKTIDDSRAFPPSCLLPGSYVSATIMDIDEKGLQVMVLNEFKGSVHKNHLKSFWDLPKRDYKIAQKINGIILYQHPASKVVYLSLRTNLDFTEIQSIWNCVRIGQIVDKALVVGKDESGTIIFKFGTNLKAVAPRSQLSDEFLTQSEIVELENKFSIRSKHRIRIKSISYIDGFVKATLKPSLLNKDDFSIDNVDIGSFVKGKVKRLTTDGLVLQLGFNVQGFVPKIHLSDKATISNLEQLFPLEKEIKCRIIRMDKSVDPPKIALTCKKSLMNKNLKIIDFFSKAQIGMETDGVICLITDYGVLIEFFNGVRGFAPNNLLSESKITNPRPLFKVGQIVHCYIVSTMPSTQRIVLSLMPLQARTERKHFNSFSENDDSKNKKSTIDDNVLNQKIRSDDTSESIKEKKIRKRNKQSEVDVANEEIKLKASNQKRNKQKKGKKS